MESDHKEYSKKRLIEETWHKEAKSQFAQILEDSDEEGDNDEKKFILYDTDLCKKLVA
jgi:hypothetical protein